MTPWFCCAFVVGLALVPGSAPSHEDATTNRLTAAVLAEERRGFSGAVLVAKDRDVRVDLALGTVAGKATVPDSQYFVASIGKQFTAAAVLHCLDRRRLAVDTRLSQIWTDVPGDKRGITVRQVLAHASGLPSSDTGELAANADEARRSILALALASRAGATFAYSNANYQLAAAIAERACGEPYGHVVTRLIGEAGLRDTGRLPDDSPGRLAPLSHPMPARLSRLRWGGQGYFSTTRDLFLWHAALADGRILSQSMRRAQLTPVVAIQEGHAALGWFLGRTASGTKTVFTRGNEDFGPNGLLYYYPAARTTIVILTHAGDAGEMSWSRAMLAVIEGALGL